MLTVTLFVLTVLLAYSNGANDNFKGVATLFGSGTLNYSQALALATVATVLGSVFSVFFVGTFIQNFSGRGLVPDDTANTAVFHVAVVTAVGITVISATLKGFPISTTHAIIGALFGAGVAAVGSDVNFTQLGTLFLLPLLVCPVIAIMLGFASYYLFKFLHLGKQVTRNGLQKTVTTNRRSLLSSLHCLSGGAVCFARGMNDTPKIVALMFVVEPFSIYYATVATALGMAVGGILNSRRVAYTISKKIVTLTESDGFAANLTTSFLVIFSSKLGFPVSTTHVSVGSIVGVGFGARKVHLDVFRHILLSWILTLPLAALLSAIFYLLLLTVVQN